MNTDTFIVQEFVTRRKRLVPGQRASARTKHHALKDAQRLANRAEGVAVIHVVVDDERGEVSAIDVLARHGLIPDDFEEAIRGA